MIVPGIDTGITVGTMFVFFVLVRLRFVVGVGWGVCIVLVCVYGAMADSCIAFVACWCFVAVRWGPPSYRIPRVIWAMT